MQTDQITGGILDGVGVNVGYDTFLRRNSLQTSQGANTLSSQSYGYDSTSRLETVTSGSQTATYAYYPNSGMLNTTSFTGGTNIARTYDPQGRLQNITTTPAADTPQSYTYTYNTLNQRTRLTREDGSYWTYVYNDRGELVLGKKYWSDTSVFWGAQTEYFFDNIGNRNYAKNGGNQLGSLRQSNYTTNSLNQYSQRSVPGAVDVTGTANAAATVSVNNQAAVRKGDYFYKELAIDNSVSPAYAQVNVVGARNNFGAGGEDAVTEKGGRVFLPRNPEVFTYDDDGNLTSDGRRNYTWDAENRLVSMEPIASVPPEAKQRLEFSYDYMARRVQKKVYVWNTATSSYQLQSALKFVYNGWILNAELDGSNALVRSYAWGQDNSGTLDGAGGIGGLLSIKEGGNSYQVGYEGNGNVVVVANASTGKAAALYEYDAFGNTLKAAGEYAQRNPFTFSTKYTDGETNLVYFGYRYYQPQTGRWLGRDPIGEQGGINLSVYVNNNPVSFTDPLGLWQKDAHTYIIELAFQNCLTSDQRTQLRIASEEVDRLWGQLEENAYQHGMRGGPDESVEHARKAAGDFMSRHLQAARSLAPVGGGYKKIPWNALKEFGQALHTITDMTSPVHEGFQIWYGPPLPDNGYPQDLLYSLRFTKWLGYVKWHADHETLHVLQSDSGRLIRIKDTARKAFVDIFGDSDCPCVD